MSAGRGDRELDMGKDAVRSTGMVLLVSLLMACGGGGGGDGASTPATPTTPTTPAPVTPAPAERPPTFTSASSATVPEGTLQVFYTATAVHPDGKPFSFELAGEDKFAFLIDQHTGGLRFANLPDFEQPTDMNRDGVYAVSIIANDGRLSSTLALTVKVTNLDLPPQRVRRIASGTNYPMFLWPEPGATSYGRMFLIERGGKIKLLDTESGAVNPNLFLDLSREVSTDGERGLLGFAISPDYLAERTIYVMLTVEDGTLEVRRYKTYMNYHDAADPASADVILRIPHPRNIHNGGWLGFRGDLLYIGVGDGGSSGDADNNAQNRASLLGKILRINPRRDDFPADPNRDYAIPSDNPFRAPDAPEVWAYGLRNPFRNSFDPQTGNLYIGDVGEGSIEEINMIPANVPGLNFGWPIMEGTQPFRGGSTAGLTPPIAEYRHGTGPREGSSVTGGVVYSGPIEYLRGQYLFADFTQPNLWSIPTSDIRQGATITSASFALRNAEFTPMSGTIDHVVAFGTDLWKNVYFVDFDGDIFVLERSPGESATPRPSALAAPELLPAATMSKASAVQLGREVIRERLNRR